MAVAGGTYLRVTPVAADPADVARVAGSYRSDELDVSWTLEADGGTLALLGPDGEAIPLQPGAPDEWFGPATITVVREGGRVAGLRVFAGRVTGIAFALEGA